MLSYSTLGSGSGPQVEKVTEAVRLVREARPELALTGPIQYDAGALRPCCELLSAFYWCQAASAPATDVVQAR